ncbi:hypothetical protein AYI68_g7437, partial [Smittium mucronatum]|jgi:ribosomal protein S19/ribosomal protein L22
MGGK